MLTIIILIALLTAFIVLMLSKLGIRDYLINTLSGLLQQLFECDFCLSFWVSFIISLCLAICCKDITFLVIPFFSTPITRFLL